MEKYTQTEDRIRQTKPEIETPASMDSRILMDSYAAMGSQQSAVPAGHYTFRRIFMKNTLKYTAAAVILIAAVLSLTLLDKTVAPAYALEQTMRACHSVRFIHMRQINPQHEDEPILIWVEFFENGLPKRIRMNLPEWQGGGDGAKDVIWENNAATVWFKEKNGVARFPEQKMADKILMMVQEQDPKTYVQDLLDAQEIGKAEVEIEHPADKAEPIRVTAFYLPDRTLKSILYVDQATQLLLSRERYTLKDGKYVLVNTSECYDYNQPIDPEMFTFDNLPDDVIRVDQVSQQVGLAQGDLTDDQAAVETTRRFWQAVIEEDFDTASQYLEGAPADFIKEFIVEKLHIDKVIKIVSVGPVQPHPNPGTGGVVVPTKLKVEKDGQIEEISFNRLGVRQVYNQPGRWTIFGGL